MRAFVLTGPREYAVQDVAAPIAEPGQVVVDIDRVGVCGTDMEFFTGKMSYLHSGHAEYPMRLGHEWCGTVSAVGDGVEASWIGQRTTSDTMLGCGTCHRCLSEFRFEIGIRGGWPGAIVEQLAVPATALHALPDSVDAVAGAMVEPGGNALRSVTSAALALELVEPGKRIVYVGLAGSPSTIDTRSLALKDVTAVGILGASDGLAGTIEQYASGAVDPRPLVAAKVGLEMVGKVLGGWRPDDAGPGPKIHIDPRS